MSALSFLDFSTSCRQSKTRGIFNAQFAGSLCGVALILFFPGLTGCSPPTPEASAAPQASEASAVVNEELAGDFANPPNAYRFVQYQLNENTLEKFPEYGIGGYMGFFYKELYQQGPEERKKIGAWVDEAHAKGSPVWLADDFGYPSGMAGGKVVEKNPDLEVRGLASVSESGRGAEPITLPLPSGAERFVSATLCEVTAEGLRTVEEADLEVGDYEVRATGLEGPWELHAFFTVIRDRDVQAQSTAAQFKHSGRYPDLLNPEAVKGFLEIMHEPILAEIDDPGAKVHGFYANEPNLMQVHWTLEDGPFACVPWNERIPETFEEMHGYELLPHLPSLYAGEELADRRVRVHFQETVGRLLSRSFARQIREWCAERGILSSGHYLLNEYLAMHVANYADLMQVVAEFDVPGVDTGIPNRDRFGSFPYEQIKFFSSIADWKDRDEVIVLLDPIIGGGGLQRLSPEIPLLLNIANWSFFHGANTFTSYLPLDPVASQDAKGRARSAAGYDPADYRWFNEYIGRLSLMLRGARRETDVALYYPISQFQALYQPSNQHWSKMRPDFLPWQKTWDETIKNLLDADLDFNVVHPMAVEEAPIEDGHLRIGRSSYKYLIVPGLEMLPVEVARKLEDFEAAGGTVIWLESIPRAAHHAAHDAEVAEKLASAEAAAPRELSQLITHSYDPGFNLHFEPDPWKLGVARFHRDDKKIYFLMNKTEQELPVNVSAPSAGSVTIMDPSTGEIRSELLPSSIQLGPLRGILLVQE
jgi:hypothetical protein